MPDVECWICKEGRHEDCAGVTFDEAGTPDQCICWRRGHAQPKEEASNG